MLIHELTLVIPILQVNVTDTEYKYSNLSSLSPKSLHLTIMQSVFDTTSLHLNFFFKKWGTNSYFKTQ